MPSPMALSAAGLEYVRAVSRVCGRELASVGINMVLAPVLDVNVDPLNPVIGMRAFGQSPEWVADCGEEAIAGFRESGLVSCAKHFPGHGDTSVDSHLALPVLHHDLKRLERVELLPFKRAIDAGVESIMMGHLALPAIDPSGQPASLSRIVCEGLLRRTLGYQGVVVTDCMDMHGARSDRGFEADIVDAFVAGADLILISQANASRHRTAASALVGAVEDGRIPLKRLARSVERVMALKESLPVRPSPAPTMVGGSTHRAVVEEAARASITVVRTGILPLRPEQRLGALTFQQQDRLSPVESAPDGDAFLSEASARGIQVRRLPMKPAREEVDSVLIWADSLDAVVVGTRRLAANPSQAVAVARLSEVAPVVLVALREPYDLGAFVGAEGLVACYGDREGQVKAAMDVIFGKSAARGKLPVIIPDLAESTFSLS